MSKNMNNDAFIRCLYRTVFDRDADEEGRRAWMTYLNAGNSRSAVISSFTSSAEFVNLCNEAGILP
jgi:hypothetical protein